MQCHEPFRPILESVDPIALSSGASPIVLLLADFLSAADTSVDEIVRLVSERKDAYKKALSSPDATDATVAAALETDVVSLEKLKVNGLTWDETSDKRLDGVYMLL